MEQDIENLEAVNPTFLSERRRTIMILIFRAFLTGVNYTITEPSLAIYIESLGGEPWFFGLIMSSYEAAASLFIPVVGYIFDKTNMLKELTYFSNLFDFFGNILYMLPYSPWNLLAGRCVSGFGAALTPAIYSEINWVYQTDDKRKLFVMLAIANIIGVSAGPLFAVPFIWVNLRIKGFTINSSNGPTLFCVIIWTIMQYLTYFFVSNVSKSYIFDKADHSSSQSENCNAKSDEDILESKTLIKETKEKIDSDLNSCKNKSGDHDYSKYIFRLDILGLLVLVFFSVETKSSFFAFINVILVNKFGWKIVDMNIFMICFVAETVFIFAIAYKLGKLFGDIKLLMFTPAPLCAGSIIMFSVVYFNLMSRNMLGLIIASLGITNISLGISVVCSRILVSNIVPKNMQGIVQAIFALTSRFGLMIGPLVGNFGLYYTKVYGIISGVSVLFASIVFYIGIKRLKESEQASQHPET